MIIEYDLFNLNVSISKLYTIDSNWYNVLNECQAVKIDLYLS